MMTAQFVEEHFIELLADVLFDNMPHGTEAHGSIAERTCNVCGKPSLRAKCDPCFRAYRVERNRAYNQRKKLGAAA